tara:strand:- start:2299 stop:3735 length:1437 start_codon:yes stop_codon:yes gene_type:complete
MPLSRRQQLWAFVPLGPLARAAVVQLLAGTALLAHTDPNSLSRAVVVMGAAIGVGTLPLARLTTYLLRNNWRIHYLVGRAWAVSVPLFYVMTVADAYDGTGLVFAEKVATPFMLSAVFGLSFAIGAQGALLAVPTDLLLHMAVTMITVTMLKLRVAYTHAYLALHAACLGGITTGYVCIFKYADLREAEREAAEAIVNTAVLTKQPYVVTDSNLTILAINQRFTDVLGYAPGEVYGKNVSMLIEQDVDYFWVTAALSKGEKEHVWSVISKAGPMLPVRITFGDTRCPLNGTKFYYAKFASMALEQRNMQLVAEKERLQWDLASQQSDSDWEDPRERLGASWYDADAVHRTLGAMQDQALVAKAVSTAHSYDHVDSRDASPVASPPLQGTSPPPPPSVLSIGSASIVSLKSSVMDTTSQAAAKDVTRAPPPTKSTRLPRPKRVCSEPSCTPTTNSMPRAPRRGPLPVVERVGPDPREDC